jgi:hypothetical protein
MSIRQWLIWSRPAILALVLAGLSSLALPGASFAACTNDADAAQKAGSFLGDTASLLNGPNGPRSPAEISADVRDFVAANPKALAAVIALIKAGGIGADQQKAMGTGLGLAAGVCLRPDPTFAAEIQTQIAGTDSPDAKTAFSSVTGNQLIGSVGGGAGGGGGSSGAAGGSTNPISNGSVSSSFQPFVSNSVSNTPGSFFGGSANGAGTSSLATTTNTTNTVTNNVVCVVSKTC